MKPALVIFYSSLILSTMTSISASNWLMFWIGMELNLLSFVPIILSDKSNFQTEASIKYFLAQAIGSALILMAATSLYCLMQTPCNNINSMMIAVGLVMKLGMPPLHFWMPQVMQGLSWINCAILNTWQKISPLIIIFNIMGKPLPMLLPLLFVMSALVGSMGGLNQTQLRPLLAYSSMSHMAWMIATSIFSKTIAIAYLSIYIIISMCIMLLMQTNQTSFINSLTSLKMTHKNQNAHIILLILSLGGLPPLLGFYPKWMAMETLINSEAFILTLGLLSSALINLFFYLRLSFNFSHIPDLTPFSTVMNSNQKILISTATLPIAPFIMYLVM